MGDLTKNISQHELDCQCGQCEITIQHWEPVIGCWQKACDYFANKYGVKKVVFVVCSGARCCVWNRVPIKNGGPGSTDGSQHIRCSAIDGKIFIGNWQVPPKEVYDYFDSQYPDSCGIGLYDSFTHFDPREACARWDAR